MTLRRTLPWLLVTIVAVVLVVAFKDPIIGWFRGDEPVDEAPTAPSSSHDAHEAHEPAASAPPALPAMTFEAPVLDALRSTLAAYERARALLAADVHAGLDEPAAAMAAGLEAAKAALHDPPPALLAVLDQTHEAALQVRAAPDIAQARQAFEKVSQGLVALGGADPRLTEGWHIFQCPMTEGFGKWLQATPRLENPYMGQQMLQCGSPTDWTLAEREPAAVTHAPGEIAHYTCPMHPSVKQSGPGPCPICGMDLVPVTKTELASGTIVVDEARRQRIGVRTEPVQMRPLTVQVRAPGEVVTSEDHLHEVNLRVSGWVEELFVDQTGQKVEKGQRLFTLYSPELYAAQLEHLAAGKREGMSGPGMFANLQRASYNRLLLLGMSKAQITALEKQGAAWEHLPITSPASGYIIEKNIIAGARVDAGQAVYRIGDLGEVWIDAQVYEADLPLVHKGQAVDVSLPFVPDRAFEAKIDYVYPVLDEQTRTARVRIVLDNRDLVLKPGMYADVSFTASIGERLAVPESAVLYTGPRRLVFVDLGEGRLQPQTVELGTHADGYYAVQSGLEAGDVVVTSGNFLIAAESRIRSAAGAWEVDPHASH